MTHEETIKRMQLLIDSLTAEVAEVRLNARKERAAHLAEVRVLKDEIVRLNDKLDELDEIDEDEIEMWDDLQEECWEPYYE